MSAHKDKLKGGLADKKQPKDFDPKALQEGEKHEMEHTNDNSIAREIAMDHLQEDPNYYKKIKTIEKTMLEVTPDGHQEIVAGKEPLKKDPKKKSLKDRWKELKKMLDSSTAFMPMMEDEDEDSQDPEAEQQPEQQPAPAEESNPEASDSAQEQNAEPQQDAGEVHPDDLADALKEAGYSDAEIAYIVHGHGIPGPNVDEAKYNSEVMDSQVNAQNAMGEAEQQKQIRDQEAKMKLEHANKLNEVQLQDVQEKKQKNKLDLDHHKRMLDLEYEKHKQDQGDGKSEHSRRMADLEFEEAQGKKGISKVEAEHQKKMLQLEYEAAKKEKELEMEFKKREHEVKIKLMEDQAKQQAKMKDEIGKEKHKHKLAEAKTPPEKKPLKKSEDNEDVEE